MRTGDGLERLAAALLEGEGSQEEAWGTWVGLRFGEVNGREPVCRAAEGPGLRTGRAGSVKTGAGTQASASLCELSLQPLPGPDTL